MGVGVGAGLGPRGRRVAVARHPRCGCAWMVIAAVLTAGLLLMHVSDFFATDSSSQHLSSFLSIFDRGAGKSGGGGDGARDSAPAIRACRDDEESDLRDWAVEAAGGPAAAGDLVVLRMPEIGPLQYC